MASSPINNGSAPTIKSAVPSTADPVDAVPYRAWPAVAGRKFGCGRRWQRLLRWPLFARRWVREFPGTRAQVRAARLFVQALLEDTKMGDDASFIVGELASNAIMWSRSGHPGGNFLVRVTRRRRWVQIAVTDQGSHYAPITLETELEALAESGRGLACIEALAKSGGTYRTIKGTRVVWIQLSIL
jgi:serine/threonine-protein kinase RsbW